MTNYTVAVTPLASRAGTTKYSFTLQLEGNLQVEGELHVDTDTTGFCLARGLQGGVRDNSGAYLGRFYCSRQRGSTAKEALERQFARAADKAATRPWEEYSSLEKAIEEGQQRVDRGPLPPAAAAAAAAERGYVPMTFTTSREWYGWTNPAGSQAISWRDCSWPGEPFQAGFEVVFTIEGGMNPAQGAVRFFTNHGTFAARGAGGTRVEAIPGWPA